MKSREAQPGDPIANLAIGTIIEVDGTHVTAELHGDIAELSRVYGGVIYPIGQFGSIVRIHYGRKIIYGYVCRLRMKVEYQRERGIVPDGDPSARIIEADLFGEGEWLHESDHPSEGWRLAFERGVSTFPLPQQAVYLTPRSELKFVFGLGGVASLHLGEHVGSGGTPAHVDMNELLGKHTAILGSTGSGKSGTVAALLHAILERGKVAEYDQWNPRIVLLDPHNEYHSAFPGHERLSTDEGTLSLPYWMLDLDETIGLLVGRTEHVATSQSNIVKNALLTARQTAVDEGVVDIPSDEVTVDSPVPYILGDPNGLDEFGKLDGEPYTTGFVGAINAQRPDNRNKKDHEDFNKVLRKVTSLMKDSRLRFIMKPWSGDKDDLANVMGQFVGPGPSVRIIDLSGAPSEVAGTASAAIARTLFSIKLWQHSRDRATSPVLLVCEEAHRYVPRRGEAQYGAAQQAIQRLAKEGRKYGISLILVSQRPSEIDATVLSQCNSWIVLRLTNDADREHVRGILPDSLAGLTKVLSGLRRREAIVVGEATPLPSRVRIRNLEADQLPRSHDVDFDSGWQFSAATIDHLRTVANCWRLQQRDDVGSESSKSGAGKATTS
ncbi:MAG: ATP-binding protein [Pirellulales bacterium]